MRRLAGLLLGVLIGGALVHACACVDDRPARAQGPDARRRTPLTGVTCFGLAQRRTALTPFQQQALCLGAPTPSGPVDCFVEATNRLLITEEQGVALCRCSASTEPVECWNVARRETRLTDGELAHLCSPSLALGLLANCRRAGS